MLCIARNITVVLAPPSSWASDLLTYRLLIIFRKCLVSSQTLALLWLCYELAIKCILLDNVKLMYEIYPMFQEVSCSPLDR